MEFLWPWATVSFSQMYQVYPVTCSKQQYNYITFLRQFYFSLLVTVPYLQIEWWNLTPFQHGRHIKQDAVTTTSKTDRLGHHNALPQFITTCFLPNYIQWPKKIMLPPSPLPRTWLFFGFYRKHTSLEKLPFRPPFCPPSTLVSAVQTYYLWILMTFVNELQLPPE